MAGADAAVASALAAPTNPTRRPGLKRRMRYLRTLSTVLLWAVVQCFRKPLNSAKKQQPGGIRRVAMSSALARTVWPRKQQPPGLEFVVHPAADHALVELDADRRCGKAVGEPACRLLESDGEIFGLRRPIVGHGDFDAEAGTPAQFRAAGPWQRVQRCLDVGKCAAACRVKQHAVKGVADAAAKGADPIAGTLATGGNGAGQSTVASDHVSFDILPVEVALDAEHKLADLVIAADGAAGERAADVEPARRTQRRGPIALAESVAGIEADIEAGPAESRCNRNIC